MLDMMRDSWVRRMGDRMVHIYLLTVRSTEDRVGNTWIDMGC